MELVGELTGATLATAERVVARLVKDGDVAADRAEELVQDLLSTTARSRDQLVQLIRAEIARAVEVLDLATRDDLDDLEQRLREEERP